MAKTAPYKNEVYFLAAQLHESPQCVCPSLKLQSTLVANEFVSARELHPRCKRVTSTRQKGDDPRTDPMREGAHSDLPGWQPKEKAALTAKAGYDCLNNATSLRRPEAVGWAPSVCAGPLATSLRGLWVSGLLPTGKGGTHEGAATPKPTRR